MKAIFCTKHDRGAKDVTLLREDDRAERTARLMIDCGYIVDIRRIQYGSEVLEIIENLLPEAEQPDE